MVKVHRNVVSIQLYCITSVESLQYLVLPEVGAIYTIYFIRFKQKNTNLLSSYTVNLGYCLHRVYTVY